MEWNKMGSWRLRNIKYTRIFIGWDRVDWLWKNGIFAEVFSSRMEWNNMGGWRRWNKYTRVFVEWGRGIMDCVGFWNFALFTLLLRSRMERHTMGRRRLWR
jgi:hypothetical protein